MKLQAVKALFFDMGNTLLHFHDGSTDEEKDEAGLRRMTEYLQGFCPSVTVREVRSGFFDPWMEKLEKRATALTEYQIDHLLLPFLAGYGVAFSREHCVETMRAFYSEYISQVQWEPKLRESLLQFKEMGYRLGVVSNACLYDEVMKDCFVQAGVADLFESYTFSYGADFCKPRPEIFMQALASMSLAPHEAVMIGDHAANDLEPAVRLGMQAVLYDRGQRQASVTAGAEDGFIRIRSISELVQVL
jgi:HAD superfamily hydrolase (TIGR01509 family)